MPVTIFSTIAVSKIYPEYIISAGIMLGAIFVCCSLAYLVCRILHFSSKLTGLVVLLSGFGSTSTLAYPFIIQTFGSDSEAVSLGLMIGEFGVCIPFFTIGVAVPFFTLGVLLAFYFGAKEHEKDKKFYLS